MIFSSSVGADLARPVPKLLGADCELGNFENGRPQSTFTGQRAAQLLLRAIDELGIGSGVVPERVLRTLQDWERRYLASNGGCVYIDLDHLELCIPEVLSAIDFVGYKHAMLEIARQAKIEVDTGLPPGRSVEVLVNNSDGQGNAYGSHISVLVSRRTWDGIFSQKLHHLLYLASFQVAHIILSGQGKVGAENGHPKVAYQISARGDFFECLVGPQTTHHRPIVNGRDEPLCGQPIRHANGPQLDQQLARLHVIFFDNTLNQVASYLTVGALQIILTMIESNHVDLNCILDDPVEAIQVFSHDPTLRAKARMASGRQYTAVELQFRFLEDAARFVESGACDEVVPGAHHIIELWRDTLMKLHAASRAGEPEALSPLAPRLDWVLKQQVIRRALAQRPHLSWSSPEIKHLDHLYSSLSDDGLFRAFERSGAVEQLVSRTDIEKRLHEPPTDTRAWTRAMLLRHAPTGSVAEVDWDRVRFKSFSRSWWPTYRNLNLENPLGLTEAQAGASFREAHDVVDLLNRLDAVARSTAETQVAEDELESADLDLVEPIPMSDAAELGSD